MLEEHISAEQLLGMLKLKRAEAEAKMQLEVCIRQMSESPESTSYDVVLRDIEPELVATYREVAADDKLIAGQGGAGRGDFVSFCST